MPAEYVLLLMQHTEMSRDYKETQVNQIFEASGASLVVETRVSGSVEDYRLDYKLRRKKDIKLGVVFDKTMEGALQAGAANGKTRLVGAEA